MIPPRPHIAAMAPYALARMEPPPGRPLISLAQNESLRPPSPAVLDALKAAHPAETYPDPDWTRLRKAIAGVHDLDPALILCGAGSLDLIACLARAYAGPDRAVLAPAHAYPFFHAAAQMAGARFDTAPEEDFTVSVDALLDAVRPDTGLLFLANPGNPTGTRIPASEIRRLRDALRETSCWSSTRPMASSQTKRTRPSSTRGPGRHGRPAHLLQGLWPRGGAGRLGCLSARHRGGASQDHEPQQPADPVPGRRRGRPVRSALHARDLRADRQRRGGGRPPPCRRGHRHAGEQHELPAVRPEDRRCRPSRRRASALARHLPAAPSPARACRRPCA
jgi:hypothetical protein